MADTKENFKVLKDFMNNYTQIEEKMITNINQIDEKISRNNEKIQNVSSMINEKIGLIQTTIEFFTLNAHDGGEILLFHSVYYFLFLFLLVWLITQLQCLNSSRLILNGSIFAFFLLEKYLIHFVLHKTFFYYFVDVSLLSSICRVACFVWLIAVICCKANKFNQVAKDNEADNNCTPLWMRKYYSKIKRHNETLIVKFHSMCAMMDAEKEKMKKVF